MTRQELINKLIWPEQGKSNSSGTSGPQIQIDQVVQNLVLLGHFFKIDSKVE